MAGICGIVGSSRSGKTSVAELLLARLRARGLRVGYLKHAHKGFDADREDSDSWRARKAGADAVAVVHDTSAFLLDSPGNGPEPTLARMAACDVILVEGYHQASWPKVVVSREGIPEREVDPPVLGEVAFDADGQVDDETLDGLADAIAALSEEGDEHDELVVDLVVDGTPVPLGAFATSMVAGTMMGMVETLKGVESPASVQLTVRRPTKDLRT